MNSSEEKLKHIAFQLSHPTGEAGLEMGVMMNETNIGMTLESIKALQLSSGNRVLELGHGNAGHVANLLSQAEDLQYYGLEISETMHAEAARINQEFIHNKQANFTLYDGEKTPFADEYFDCIFTVNTLYFWPKPLVFLNEIHRILKKKAAPL